MTAPVSYFGCVAIPVSNLEHSTRFYCDALGFTERKTTHPTAGMTARFVEKNGTVFELVEVAPPPPPAEPSHPVDRIGKMTHIAFNVANLAEAEKAIVACGGTIVEATRVKMDLVIFGPTEIVYARDPDGIWIELLSVDEAARRRYGGLDD